MKGLGRGVVRCFMLAGLLGTVPGAFAAPAAWYENVTVKNLVAGQASTRIWISTDPVPNYTGCPGAELTLDQANPFFKQIYAMLMLAVATGRTIAVYTNGQCSQYGLQLTDVRLSQ